MAIETPEEYAARIGEVRSVDPNTGAEKGTKPLRYDLIPRAALDALARHYGRGARKYEDHNWRKGYAWSKSYAALQRHLTAWWDGEDLDPDPVMMDPDGTFASHLDAVLWHAAVLTTFAQEYPEGDDRFRRPNGESND